MGAVDPTYPLYPIALILASIMLLLVLTTSFVRQSWNLGVIFLCFWLLLECATQSATSIIWSDNADLKLYAYCDIVTHLQFISSVVKPMATLIITRRLYLIARLQSVEAPSKAARRWDLAVEWTLGLVIPLLVAGPIYYVNQGARFEIQEGLGCISAEQDSILDLLISQSWSILPPLASIILYCPKVMLIYYRQMKDVNSFLRSNHSVSRTNYLRILVLASIDIVLTLPIGIANIIFVIVGPLSNSPFPKLYPGWTLLHSDWEPANFTYAEAQSSGTATLAATYFSRWTSPVLAFTIFGLFGATSTARASYWHIIRRLGGWFGWKPTPRAERGRTSLGAIEFGARPRNTSTSGIDLEMGSRTPSFVNMDTPAVNQVIEHASSEGTAQRTERDLKSVEEGRREFEYIDDADIQMVGCRIPADEYLSSAYKGPSVMENEADYSYRA